MATISVHDYDYFHYTSMIPNLECMKYLSYNINRHNLSVLSKDLDIEKFTTTIIRKDVDDYEGVPEAVHPRVDFGGRTIATRYVMLPQEVEYSIPNILPYEKYRHQFATAQERVLDRTIFSASHLRLDDNPSYEYLQKCITQKSRTIIFHDYGLSAANMDLVKDLSQQHFLNGNIRRMRIGAKFPVHVNSVAEISKWYDISIAAALLPIQYNGLFEDGELDGLTGFKDCRFSYNPLYGRSEADGDFEETLGKIFRQAIFLQRSPYRLSLIYDTGEARRKEYYTFLRFLSSYATRPRGVTFVKYCKYLSTSIDLPSKFQRLYNRDDAREMLGYFYDTYPDFFDILNYFTEVRFEGGKLQYVGKRNL